MKNQFNNDELNVIIFGTIINTDPKKVLLDGFEQID